MLGSPDARISRLEDALRERAIIDDAVKNHIRQNHDAIKELLGVVQGLADQATDDSIPDASKQEKISAVLRRLEGKFAFPPPF